MPLSVGQVTDLGEKDGADPLEVDAVVDATTLDVLEVLRVRERFLEREDRERVAVPDFA